jgi:GNAT superfamily N-acetyltransferase
MEFPDRTTTLRDGTRVLLRAARPEDGPLVRLGFDQLSDRSRQFRFLRAIPRLAEDDLSFLAGAGDNAVIGALDLGADPPAPLGLARYIRIPGHSGHAELAITVVDSHQKRGLGTLLFGCLAWQARRAGLCGFAALVHRRNRQMRSLLEDLGARIEDDQGGELHYLLPLPADPADWPATPAGDAFRAAWQLAEGA